MPRTRTRASKSRRAPRQARSAATVDAILTATAQLLARDGARTTTNHIAERAGVSVGSIYEYFGNKEALFAALADKHFQALEVAAMEDFQTRARLGWRGFVTSVQRALVVEHSNLGVSAALHALAWQYPKVAERVNIFVRKTETIAATAFRVDPEIIDKEDLDLTARILMRAMAGIVHHTLAVEPELLEKSEFADQLEALADRYLAPRRAPSAPSSED